MADVILVDPFSDMDEASAAIIIQLQIEDSLSLAEELEGKGKHRAGETTDKQTANTLYREDLQRFATIASDRRMTRSIAQACQVDGSILNASQSEEQAAAQDRAVACRIGGVVGASSIPPWTISSEEMDEELLAKLSALYVETPQDQSEVGKVEALDEEEEAEASGWAATRAPSALYRQCVACQENFRFFDVARAPCDHEYCRTCLQELFRASIVDDSLFPPRCCRQPITIGGPTRIFLPLNLIKQYEDKKIEVETTDRTYCCNPQCSIFMRPGDIANEKATCPDCSTVTCTLCKAISHGGDCPADVALQLVLQTADENGWQRCYTCRRLVELDIGCNHITCPCGAQFCYVCAERWKTYACPQWSEERLMTRANQVVARRRVQENERIAQVAVAADNLRNRHNCNHDSWQYVRGEHRCEECYHTLPSYIFECRQCQIQACNRCRRNRL